MLLDGRFGGGPVTGSDGRATFRVLVPLDGTDLSECALPWAELLATPLKASVELVRVLPHDLITQSVEAEVTLGHRLTADGEEVPDPALITLEGAEARQELEAARSRFHNPDGVSIAVAEGDPAEEIIDRARRTDITTLIAMTTHARSGLGRVLLGSVTEDIIRRSGVPVLALRPDIATPADFPRRVLIPLDGSSLGDAVVPALLPVLKALGWSVLLVSVLPAAARGIPVQGATIPLPSPEGPHDAEQASAHLEAIAQTLRTEHIQVETQAIYGDRVTTIVERVHSAACGLIAMSTHGHSGLHQLLMGSMTEALIRSAPVPVLAVHPLGGSGHGF